LLPEAYFLSVPSPEKTEPNAMVYVPYLDAAQLAAGVLVLSTGLV